MPKFGPRFATPHYFVAVRTDSALGWSTGMTTADPQLVTVQAKAYLSSRPAGVVDVYYSEYCGHCGRKEASRRKSCRVCHGSPEVTPETRIYSFVGPEGTP